MIDETPVPNDSDYIYSPQCDGTLIIELREGGALIATRTVNRSVIGSPATYIYTLTAGERASISNWSNLQFWFTVNASDTAKIQLGTMRSPDVGTVSLYIRLYMQE